MFKTVIQLLNDGYSGCPLSDKIEQHEEDLSVVGIERGGRTHTYTLDKNTQSLCGTTLVPFLFCSLLANNNGDYKGLK